MINIKSSSKKSFYYRYHFWHECRKNFAQILYCRPRELGHLIFYVLLILWWSVCRISKDDTYSYLYWTPHIYLFNIKDPTGLTNNASFSTSADVYIQLLGSSHTIARRNSTYIFNALGSSGYGRFHVHPCPCSSPGGCDFCASRGRAVKNWGIWQCVLQMKLHLVT